MKNNSYGYKTFRKNLGEYGRDALLDTVRQTREDIDRHYHKPFEPDNLIKRWSRLEYHRSQRLPAYVPVAVGYGIGFLTAFYFFLMSLPPISGSVPLLVGLTVLFLALAVLSVFLIIYGMEKNHDDPYRNYILPYEQLVLARKLEAEHGFSIEGVPEQNVPGYDLESLELFDEAE